MCRVLVCWYVSLLLISVLPSPWANHRYLSTGVEKGYYQFTSHLIAELIRVVSKGSAPGNNLFIDALYSVVALVSPLLPLTTSEWFVQKTNDSAGCTDLEDDYGLASQGI